MKRTPIYPYLFLFIMLVSVGAIINADADYTGKIVGVITDSKTNVPIPNALVMVVGTDKGDVTDKDGNFKIEGLEPGRYNLEVSCENYKLKYIKAVSVRAGTTVDVSSIMQPLRQVVLKNDIGIKDEIRVAEEKEYDKVQSLNQSCVVPQVVKKGKRVGRVDYFSTPEPSYYPPAHGGTSIVNNQPFDAMFFKHYGVNPFIDTEDDHLSTFATDIDDASFSMARSYLDRGSLPPDEAVRTEEFVNHFEYNYGAPRHDPFAVYVEGAPSRFGNKKQLIKIGIKGKEISQRERKDANLVFVIDVSGSMNREDRLTLVKKSLRLLVDELRPSDRVGIVIYGSQAQKILKPTSIAKQRKIIRAIESLQPGGATNAEDGIMMGYRMADRNFESGKINRVILCSDGVANVGRTGPKQILKQIKKFADKGITLSTIGFGMGNYNDVMMEKLGNKGNGYYAYVDNLNEARDIFVDNLTGSLQVIARDVKIQVDFNPDVVRSYRLIGYENRNVADNKFRDDSEDGGEIGAGHQVTALYEVKLKKNKRSQGKQIATVYIRYKDPDNFEVNEFSLDITKRDLRRTFDAASYDFKLAACAAEFAEILRNSYWSRGSSLNDCMTLAQQLVNENTRPYPKGKRRGDYIIDDDDLLYPNSNADVIELLSMISKASQLKEYHSEM